MNLMLKSVGLLGIALLVASCASPLAPRQGGAPVGDAQRVVVVEPRKETVTPGVSTSAKPRYEGGIATGVVKEPEVVVGVYQPAGEPEITPAHTPRVKALLDEAHQREMIADYDGAIALMEQGLRDESRNPYLLSRLAGLWLAKGDARQAEQFARKSLRYTVGDNRLKQQNWSLVAKALRSLGDEAGAREAEQSALGSP